MHAIKNYFLEFPSKLFRMYQRKDETEIWTFGFFCFSEKALTSITKYKLRNFEHDWIWRNKNSKLYDLMLEYFLRKNFNPFSRKKIVVANEFTVMKSFGANNCWNQPKSSWLVTENSELQKNFCKLFFSYCPLIQRK